VAGNSAIPPWFKIAIQIPSKHPSHHLQQNARLAFREHLNMILNISNSQLIISTEIKRDVAQMNKNCFSDQIGA
jgi:hypothetical protein